jgi:hypothetical protein
MRMVFAMKIKILFKSAKLAKKKRVFFIQFRRQGLGHIVTGPIFHFKVVLKEKLLFFFSLIKSNKRLVPEDRLLCFDPGLFRIFFY